MIKLIIAAAMALGLSAPAFAACPTTGNGLNLEIPALGASGSNWAACVRRNFQILNSSSAWSTDPGTATVRGNAFSVGGSSFVVTGGSVTIAHRLNVGSIEMSSSSGTITTKSSITASAFFGDGSQLSGLAGAQTTTSNNFNTAATEQTFGSSVTFKGRVDFTGATNIGGAQIVQIAYCEDNVSTTYASANIPFDDTIPQNTEGAEVQTCSITPKNAANYLLVQAKPVFGENSNTSDILTVALFRDSTADAIDVDYMAVTANSSFDSGVQQGPFNLERRVAANSTSATTFKVRAGLNNSNTIRFNGAAGGRKFGGAMYSTIVITEFKP